MYNVHISKTFLVKMTWDLSYWKTVDILKVVPYILGCTALKITSTFPSVQGAVHKLRLQEEVGR